MFQQQLEVFDSAFVLIDNPDLSSEIDSLLCSCSDRTGLEVSALKDMLRVLLIIAKGKL